MRFREFKQRLLVEMYHRQKEIGLQTFMEPKDVADGVGLIYDTGQIRLCLSEYKNSGLVHAAFTMGSGPDLGLKCFLTARGIEQAEEWEEQLGVTLQAPASDRVVPLDHNTTEYQSTIASLDKVIAEVRAERRNDFFDKEQRLAELDAGKALLSADRVSLRPALAVFSTVLGYLALKFVDVPIGQAAQSAWEAVLKLFGLS